MFRGLSRHVRYECCAVDLQEVSTQQGWKCLVPRVRSWRAERVKASQPGDVGLCALLACAYFGFCAKTDARNKTLKHQSNKTNNFSEDLTRCTLGFEQALFCCCLGGLPLCGQWRVGKHGEACQRKRWCRITGIPLKMKQQSEVCELHSKKKTITSQTFQL